ncbi:unnamed protein product [Mytilus edulis]|uniref:Uncharacterized protein n=1 Tax=Mytilus edulis TaxID=6550 RepID=A0A8S3RXQ2_MYTED|nr:unnamed protein product [Mytilus edulis]
MGLHILQWNARSLYANANSLKHYLDTHNNPEIICVQETRFKDNRSTSTHQRLHSSPLPSPADSSGTDPNLNTFVPVVEITTDDHEEITKPVHVDQTTVDEISKPSSEKTTMKNSISSQQYGSTSTQHNVSSEPTGKDSENVRIYMWIYPRITCFILDGSLSL